ncbi:MAG: Hint domain-containing protein [Roseobacter sp.]
MTWLAVSDVAERRFSRRGVGHDRTETKRHPDTHEYLLSRGSLVFETRISPDGRPQILLGYNKSWPAQRSLTFQAIPGGGISMVQVNGENIAHTAIQHAISARTDVLRITLSWDAPKGWAQFTVERPEAQKVSSKLVQGIKPIPLCDLRDMMLSLDDSTFSKDVIYAALSDAIEPVGPVPSLHLDAMINTPRGYQTAGSLQRGDTVVTRDGDVVPILHTVKRCVPARGSFAPVRLRAPYFGLLEDVIVSPEQRLVIDGSEVEYLFNQEAVLVPARHLVNGFAARLEPPQPTAVYTQFILPKHEAVMVAGTPLESLYIGRLRRNRAILQNTVLKNLDRNQLPEHGRAVYKELKWYDAIHLARQRAA